MFNELATVGRRSDALVEMFSRKLGLSSIVTHGCVVR